MSKINPGLYQSDDHTWETPPKLLQAILTLERRSAFDLDAACSKKNVPAVAHFVYPEDNALEKDWIGLTWVNPPYGDQLKPFVRKMMEEGRKAAKIWALLPARTETSYQHDYGLTVAGFTVFMRGRLKFLQNGVEGGTAPFPTMLLYFGDDWKEKAARWTLAPAWPGVLMVVR